MAQYTRHLAAGPMVDVDSLARSAQGTGAAYDILPIFHSLRPPSIPLIDRLFFTISIARHLAVDYAKVLLRLLPAERPGVFLPKPCCKRGSLQLQDLIDDHEDEVAAPGPETTPYLVWYPTFLRPSVGIGLPRKCEHGHRVRRWILRYELPALPDFPDHVSLSINIVVNNYYAGPAIVNHYYQAVTNLTRLHQVHVPRAHPAARLWYPEPLDENDRMNNVLFFDPSFATKGSFLADLEQIQAALLARLVNGAVDQYLGILDQASDLNPCLPAAWPVARLKLAEVYEDVRSNSPSEDIAAQLEAARHAVSTVMRHTDPGWEGGYGPIRPGEWLKLYRKSLITWRRELLMASRTLRSAFKGQPLPYPVTATSMLQVVDTLVWKYLELAVEVDANARLVHYDPAALDWTPLFEQIGIAPGDYELARQLIIDHHNTPVARNLYDKAQKKILTKLFKIAIYAWNSKGKQGLGRIIPGAAMAALMVATKTRRATMRSMPVAVATR